MTNLGIMEGPLSLSQIPNFTLYFEGISPLYLKASWTECIHKAHETKVIEILSSPRAFTNGWEMGSQN